MTRPTLAGFKEKAGDLEGCPGRPFPAPRRPRMTETGKRHRVFGDP